MTNKDTKQEQLIIHWSGGKDASMALLELQQTNKKITTLLTTINDKLQRVTMHGIPLSLIRAQSQSIGLPLETISLPEDISMQAYTLLMNDIGLKHAQMGITGYAYGDINLVDLRAYRDKALGYVHLSGHYPLWDKDTTKLAKAFIDKGFKAIVVAVNSTYWMLHLRGEDLIWIF